MNIEKYPQCPICKRKKCTYYRKGTKDYRCTKCGHVFKLPLEENIKNEVVIDGITYIRKEIIKKTFNKDVKRFSSEQEKKIQILIKRMFSLEEHPISEEEALEKDFVVIDPANVVLIAPKTEEAKRLLSRFRDSSGKSEVPELDYKVSKKDEETSSKFSIEYITNIINIFNTIEDDVAIKISVKKDYPITIENKHFKIILAPRIEQ